MISPADMLLLVAVVREGSFTGAARRLGVTKQTVSERIGNLESQLGVRLLERTTRHLRLTDAGASYHARCASIAAQIDEANAEAQRRQAEPVGTLRVSAPVLYGRRYLTPVVAEYLARYPQTRVELLLADRRVNLVDEGFDLAIRVGRLDDSSLTARKLGEGHVHIVASPAFVDRHGAPEPAALRSARCIGMRPVETWEVAGEEVKIVPVMVVNDLEVVCEAAAAGVGVARLPSLVCREAVRAGRLRVLFGAVRVDPVYAVLPSREHLAPRVRVFIEALTALVEPAAPLDLARRPRRAHPRPASG